MTIRDQHGPQGESKRMATGWKLGATFMFVLAVVGAVPTVMELYKAYVLGIDWSQVPFAVQQRRLWEKNYMCASQPGYEVPTDQPVSVRVVPCPSGDVLVTVYPSGAEGRAIWVPAEGFKSAGGFFSGIAHAQDRAPGGSETTVGTFAIQCQEWSSEEKTKIVRIVKQGERCFREEINVLTGKIGPRVEVACTSKCTGQSE